MPLKPHPTDPDKMVYVSRKYNFGEAPIKAEGASVYTDEELEPYKKQVETVYVERRVPKNLEKKTHKLIDKFLKSKGYDPEEI